MTNGITQDEAVTIGEFLSDMIELFPSMDIRIVDNEIEINKKKIMTPPKAYSRGNEFLILATKTDSEVKYMQEEVEVTANSWEAAYQQIRDAGMTPLIDTYQISNN